MPRLPHDGAGASVSNGARQSVSHKDHLPPDLLTQLIPPLREWAQNRFGDLTRELEEDARFRWTMVRKT